jgi:pimeloyl-[acyl-carrier protein] methyl ester esterase
MRLHAETAGRGPDLVLLHGWGLHSGIWTPLLPALSRRYCVTSVDLPGHGHSTCPPDGFGLDDAATAIAAVVPRHAAWLGWSLGGQLAMSAALAGHAISRLVLVATTPRFIAASDWPCALAAETLAGFAASLRVDHRQAVRNFLALQLRGDRRAATLLPALRETLLERGDPAPAGLRAGLEILAATDLRERLAALRQPALVIAGERDRLTPAAAGRRLAAALPDGSFIELPGAAHAPFLTHPEAFVAAVAGFLPGEAAVA